MELHWAVLIPDSGRTVVNQHFLRNEKNIGLFLTASTGVLVSVLQSLRVEIAIGY